MTTRAIHTVNSSGFAVRVNGVTVQCEDKREAYALAALYDIPARNVLKNGRSVKRPRRTKPADYRASKPVRII